MDKTALYSISYGLYVVGAKMNDRYCGCVVDALIQAAAGEQPILALSCMKNNKTTECIKESGEFTISVLSTEVDPFIIANFGFQSSRNVDKWANCAYQTIDGLPVLKEAVSYMRCKVNQMIELSTHIMYIAEVADAWNGSGIPLLYAKYQSDRKGEVMRAFQEYKETGKPPKKDGSLSGRVLEDKKEEKDHKEDIKGNEGQEKWVCSICGYEYNGGVPFEELTENYVCPICSQPKEVFKNIVE